MYADRITDSMALAIDETTRRRDKQIAYNLERGIDPQPLRKKIADITDSLAREQEDTERLLAGKNDPSRKRQPTPNLRREGVGAQGAATLEAVIADLNAQMLSAAAELKFELAGRLRDELSEVKKERRQMEAAGHGR